MSRKKVFKTAEEAVEYLFLEELESEMIVLPLEVDGFFDDSETLDPSQFHDDMFRCISPIGLLPKRFCKESGALNQGYRPTGFEDKQF
ncbi:hypothetical protein NPIL_121771 [Nephila pilipes]|uniref:Uncharacterized protein n=1 Tax=Nephila pilipes TaxID=299642 RepID=A0A8X6R1M0_NEPPI|nr:hypothetical protein NPIL_121771 [Nephila pilipes]